MSSIKVGIVEDEMIIAQGIVRTLQELGYETSEPAISYTEALGMIVQEKPDILLLDIMLKGHKDGIDLAWKVKEEFDIPFIFLTANADMNTVTRAKDVSPNAYLVKPYSKDQLYSAIEICLGNFAARSQRKEKEDKDTYIIKDYVFIKHGLNFQKLKIADILYLEAENNYVALHTEKQKLLVRSSIQSYMDYMSSDRFFRVHKRYAVNIDHIDSLNNDSVSVKGTEIPIGRTYKDELLAYLGLD